MIAKIRVVPKVDSLGDLVAELPARLVHLPPAAVPLPRIVCRICTGPEIEETSGGIVRELSRPVLIVVRKVISEPALGPFGLRRVISLSLDSPEVERVREGWGLPRKALRAIAALLKGCSHCAGEHLGGEEECSCPCHHAAAFPALKLPTGAIVQLLAGHTSLPDDSLPDGDHLVVSPDGKSVGFVRLRRRPGKLIRVERFVRVDPVEGEFAGCHRRGIFIATRHPVPIPKPVEPVLIIKKSGACDFFMADDSDSLLKQAAARMGCLPEELYVPGASASHWVVCHEDYLPELDQMVKSAAIGEPIPRAEALKLVDEVMSEIKPQVEYADLVGSLPRWQGTPREHREVHDIDILAIPKSPDFRYERPRVNLILATRDTYEPALIHWLSGKAIIHLKRKAAEKGWKLNRYGLHTPEGTITDAFEIYRRLGTEPPKHIVDAVNRWRQHNKRASVKSAQGDDSMMAQALQQMLYGALGQVRLQTVPEKLPTPKPNIWDQIALFLTGGPAAAGVSAFYNPADFHRWMTENRTLRAAMGRAIAEDRDRLLSVVRGFYKAIGADPAKAEADSQRIVDAMMKIAPMVAPSAPGLWDQLFGNRGSKMSALIRLWGAYQRSGELRARMSEDELIRITDRIVQLAPSLGMSATDIADVAATLAERGLVDLRDPDLAQKVARYVPVFAAARDLAALTDPKRRGELPSQLIQTVEQIGDWESNPEVVAREIESRIVVAQRGSPNQVIARQLGKAFRQGRTGDPNIDAFMPLVRGKTLTTKKVQTILDQARSTSATSKYGQFLAALVQYNKATGGAFGRRTGLAPVFEAMERGEMTVGGRPISQFLDPERIWQRMSPEDRMRVSRLTNTVSLQNMGDKPWLANYAMMMRSNEAYRILQAARRYYGTQNAREMLPYLAQKMGFSSPEELLVMANQRVLNQMQQMTDTVRAEAAHRLSQLRYAGPQGVVRGLTEALGRGRATSLKEFATQALTSRDYGSRMDVAPSYGARLSAPAQQYYHQLESRAGTPVQYRPPILSAVSGARTIAQKAKEVAPTVASQTMSLASEAKEKLNQLTQP